MTIELPCFDIVIDLDDDGCGGSITSGLHEEECTPIDDEDASNFHLYNSMMDALESMILAHACAGIDVECPRYLEGIETAVSACAQRTI